MRLTLRPCAIALALCATAPAVAQGTAADYERAEGLRAKYFGLVESAVDEPVFSEDSKTLAYRRSLKGGGNAFIEVDLATLTKKPAFDQAALARGLSTAAGRSYTGANLPFARYALSIDRASIGFDLSGFKWRCRLSDYVCEKLEALERERSPEGMGPRRPIGSGPPERDVTTKLLSPDGKLEVSVVGDNLFLRGKEEAGQGRQLTFDGGKENAYTLSPDAWAPDSKMLAVVRVKPGQERYVHYVESSPDGQKQPVLTEMYYIKPGDMLSERQPVLIDVATGSSKVIDRSLFPNAYSQTPPRWWKDGRGFYFSYNQRGHQVYRIIEVNRKGAARAIIDEQAKTFISYSNKHAFEPANDGREIVWMSERDGWCHLYLYDGHKGMVKNQITKGAWAVRSLVHVDEQKRQVIFAANGMRPGEDPYFVHYYRINFDGSGLVPLTDGQGTHTVTFAPDWQTYIDVWSRVDMAPVAQLRRASDGGVLMDLERADMTGLLAAGWTAPEPFVAKGRDGVTDIYGVILKPGNFDPTKKYPVIENIYAGPHSAFAPKSFAAYRTMQAQAELGFVVVQVDGMGTNYRSKAFHDIAWKNLKDAGFPDRILWHEAAAAKYPWYDVSRVGIWGASAGGQSAMGALLFHPEFYDAAVAFAGSHDNRVDKIWWNEQYMGWPIGPEYSASSNVDNASKLQGRLMLVVGELDTNVDPASTFQVVDALTKARKAFDFVFLPGQGHNEGGQYGERRRWDFFVENLLGIESPDRNSPRPPTSVLQPSVAPPAAATAVVSSAAN